jgi:hypothetical protein
MMMIQFERKFDKIQLVQPTAMNVLNEHKILTSKVIMLESARRALKLLRCY